MSDFKKFNIHSLENLSMELDELNLSLPMSDNIEILGESVHAGQWVLPNRFVVQPMEGIDGDEGTSAPSELTFRRYERYAKGGAGLIWFEACVIEPNGKSNPRQLMLTENNLDTWKRLVERTRQSAREKWGHEIVTVLQLAHSGRWSKPHGKPKPVLIQHNPELDLIAGVDSFSHLVSDDEIHHLKDLFISSAALAAKAGFDGVEMKACHGYLCGEMLGAHMREGQFGGSYENRTRFVRECALGMKNVLPADRFVTARLTMLEPSPYPYGWGTKKVEGSVEMDLSEPLRFARELVEQAQMPLLNFSLGYPRFSPHMTRPYNSSISGAPKPPEHPLEGIVRFQNIGRKLQSVLGDVPVITAGLGWLREFMPQVAAGLVEQGWVKLIGQGRQSFAYPDSVGDILTKGKMDPKKVCLTCSLCSQIMKDVIGCNGCPIRDAEIYKPELQKGRRAAKERGLV